MARLLTSNGGTDRPWDDKAEEEQRTKPLTKEEFLALHVGIWGSLEFCRSCYGIVYNGECSQCKEQDNGGTRYKVSRLPGNNTGVSLIEKHLQQIRAQSEGGTLTDSSTTSVMNFGGPVVGRIRARINFAGDPVPAHPVINWVEGVDIAPAQGQPGDGPVYIADGDFVQPVRAVYYDGNGNRIAPIVGEAVEINLEGVEVDWGEGNELANNVEEGLNVEHGQFDEDLPMAEYHEPEEGDEDLPF